MTSDNGILLLREANRLFNVTGSLAACFVYHRDTGCIEHRLETLVAHRVIVLAPVHEDLAIRPVSARTCFTAKGGRLTVRTRSPDQPPRLSAAIRNHTRPQRRLARMQQALHSLRVKKQHIWSPVAGFRSAVPCYDERPPIKPYSWNREQN